MTHSYELNKEDIEKIIAEKFGCDTRCILLRTETKHKFGASEETITATVKISDSHYLQSIASQEIDYRAYVARPMQTWSNIRFEQMKQN